MSSFLPIPLTAAGGNSRAARSARARLQWRDRYGRWVEMGRGVKFKVRFPDGTVKSVIGKFVGPRPDPSNPKETQGQIYVSKDPNGLKDGFYNVSSANGQEIVAQLDDEALEKAGVSLGKDVNGRTVGERLDEDIPNANDPGLYADSPEGWTRVPGAAEKWTTEDRDFTITHTPDERDYVKQWAVTPQDVNRGTLTFKSLPEAFAAIEKDDQGNSPFPNLENSRKVVNDLDATENPRTPAPSGDAAAQAKAALAEYDEDGTISQLIDAGSGSADIFKALEANEKWRADAEKYNLDIMADSLQPDQKAHIAKMEPIRNAIIGLQQGSKPVSTPETTPESAPEAENPTPEAPEATPTETLEQLQARLAKAEARFEKATRPEELDRLEKTIQETQDKIAELEKQGTPQDTEPTTPDSEPEAPVEEAPPAPEAESDPKLDEIQDDIEDLKEQNDEIQKELEDQADEEPAPEPETAPQDAEEPPAEPETAPETPEEEPQPEPDVPEQPESPAEPEDTRDLNALEPTTFDFTEPNSWNQVVEGENGGLDVITARGNIMLGTDDEKQPLENIYRAISEDEWAGIVKNGYMQSDGRMNLDESEGTVATHRDPSWYLPNKVGERGRIVQIAYDPKDNWRVDPADGYLKTNAQIPSNRIKAVSGWTTGLGSSSTEDLNGEKVPGLVSMSLYNEVDRKITDAAIEARQRNEYEREGDLRELSDELRAAYQSARGTLDTPVTDEQAKAFLDTVDSVLERAALPDPDGPRQQVASARAVLNSRGSGPDAKLSDDDLVKEIKDLRDAQAEEDAETPDVEEVEPTEPEHLMSGQYVKTMDELNDLPAGSRIVTAGSKEGLSSTTASKFSKHTSGDWISPRGKRYNADYMASFQNPENKAVYVESVPGYDPAPITPSTTSTTMGKLRPGDKIGSGTVIAVTKGSETGKVKVTFTNKSGKTQEGDWWASTPVSVTRADARYTISDEITDPTHPEPPLIRSTDPGLPTGVRGDDSSPSGESENYAKYTDIGGVDDPDPDASPSPDSFPETINKPSDPEKEPARLDPPSNASPEPTEFDFGYEDKDEDYADEKFMPTDEQRDIIKGVLGGHDVAVQALAGTGKTSTLELLAKQVRRVFPKKRIIYVAFNKSVQEEAESRMPDNVESRTGDSIAWRGISSRLTKKRNNQSALRLPSMIADHFGIRDQGDVDNEDVARDMDRVIKAYTISADDEISEKHFENIDTPFNPATLGYAQAMWKDINDPNGVLAFRNDHATKIWALTRPDLSQVESGVSTPADIVFFDEAQDINPVMARVIADQKLQKIYVGDGNQAIYGFRGAENELENVNVDVELPLTKSWRFGPQVAGMGNRFLSLLGAKHKVVGGGADGTVLPPNTMQDADAVLTRSNAGALRAILTELGRGRSVGVAENYKKEIQSLVDSARWLSAPGGGRKPKIHDDLAGYTSWGQIGNDVDRGKADKKVEMLFKLVEDYGIPGLQDAVDRVVAQSSSKEETNFDVENAPSGNMPGGLRYNWDGKKLIFTGNTWAAKDRIKEIPGRKWDGDKKQWFVPSTDPETINRALRHVAGDSEPVDVVVTTAHKAKGLEWDRVRIADDFRGPKTEVDDDGNVFTQFPSPEEMRLAYVAVTRAAKVLDPGSLRWVYNYTDEEDEDPTVPSKGLPNQEPELEEDLGTPEDTPTLEEPPTLVPPEGAEPIDFDEPYDPVDHDGADPIDISKEHTTDELEEDLKKGLRGDEPEIADPRTDYEAINEKGEKDPRDVVAREWDEQRGDTENEDNLREWREGNPDAVVDEPELPPTQNPGPTSDTIPNNEENDFGSGLDPDPVDGSGPDDLAREQDLKDLEDAFKKGTRKGEPSVSVGEGDDTRDIPTEDIRDATQKRGKDTNVIQEEDQAGDARHGEGVEVTDMQQIEDAPLGSRITVLHHDWDTNDVIFTEKFLKTGEVNGSVDGVSWRDQDDDKRWISEGGIEALLRGDPASETKPSTIILYPPLKEATPQPDVNDEGIPQVPESEATDDDLSQVYDSSLILEKLAQWFPGSKFVANGDLKVASVDRTDRYGNRFTYETLVTRTGNEFFYVYERQTNHVTGEVRSRRVGTMMQSAKAMESRIVDAANWAKFHPDHKKWFENKGGSTFPQIDEINPATGEYEHFREQAIPSSALDAVRNATGFTELKDAAIAAAAQYLAQHGPGNLTNDALRNITGLSLEDVSELINAISEHVVAQDRVRKFWTWVSADGETPLFEGDTVMDAQGNVGTVSHRHYSHHSKGYVYSDYMLVHFPQAKGSKTRFRTSRKLTLIKTAQGTDGKERTGPGAIDLPLPEKTTRWKNREAQKEKEAEARKRGSTGDSKKNPPADAPAVADPAEVTLDDEGTFNFGSFRYYPKNRQTSPIYKADHMYSGLYPDELQIEDVFGLVGVNSGKQDFAEIVAISKTPNGTKITAFVPSGDGRTGMVFEFAFKPGEKTLLGPVYRGVPRFEGGDDSRIFEPDELGDTLSGTDDPQGEALGKEIQEQGAKYPPGLGMSDEDLDEEIEDYQTREDRDRRQNRATPLYREQRLKKLLDERDRRRKEARGITEPKPAPAENAELPDTIEELEAMAENLEMRAAQGGARGRVAQRALDKVYEKIEFLESQPKRMSPEEFEAAIRNAPSAPDVTEIFQNQYPDTIIKDWIPPQGILRNANPEQLLDTYRENVISMNLLMERYPILQRLGSIGGYSAMTHEQNGTAYAFVEFTGGNPKVEEARLRFHVYDKMSSYVVEYNYGVAQGHFHGQAPASVAILDRILTHETGHVFDVETGMELSKIAMEARDEFLKRLSISERLEVLNNDLSRYSKTNRMEFWAETFENWTNNIDVPDITNYVMTKALDYYRGVIGDPTFEWPQFGNVSLAAEAPSAPAV